MTENKAKRLFLAVNLSLATTKKIADAIARMQKIAEGKLRVLWVTPPNLHVTLKFLGWAHADVIDPVRDHVREAVKARKGFELGARGGGGFPNDHAARVLWVGVQDPSGTLAKLAAELEDRMEKLGFEREQRAYHPHVTVGRVKEGKGADEVLAPIKDVDFGTSLVRDVVLYESVMRSKGSEYLPVFRVPLDAPPYRAERHTREVEQEGTENEEPETHGGNESA
jgi:2'-5' RNA ligase